MDVDIKFMRPLLRLAHWCTNIQSLRRTWRMPCHSIATKFPRHYSTTNSVIKDDESKKTIVLGGNQLTQLTIGCLDLSIELVENPTDTSKIIISIGDAQNNEISECQDKQSKQSEEMKKLKPLKQHSKEPDHSKEVQLSKKSEASMDLKNLKIKDFLREQKFLKELAELDRFEQSFNLRKKEDKQLLKNNISSSKSSDFMLQAKKFQNIKLCSPKGNSNEAHNDYTVSGFSIGANCDQMYKPPNVTTSQIITNKIRDDEPITEKQPINEPMVKKSPCMGRVKTQTPIEKETPGKDKVDTQAQIQEAPNPKSKKIRFDHEYIRKQLFQSYPKYIPARSSKPESECVNTSNNENSSRLLKKMFQNLDTEKVQSEKISIVGLGQVGISTAAFILQKGLTNNLALMDLRSSWIESEALDFLHGSSFLNNPKITADSDGRNTKDSKYVIVTVGLRPMGSESSNKLAQETTGMLKNLIPGLVEQSPDATFIIASSPSDVMAWVAHKVGKIPPHRCISLGCHLDTARFKYYIGKRLNVATSCVDGYIIGEHGESSVPVWSSVTVGGIPLHKVVPNIGTKDDCQNWFKVHQQVVDGAKAVTINKGYTNWAVALSITDIIEKMKENSGRIVSVGTNVKGTNCIRDPVYLSLPSMVSPNGITHICKLPLTDWETERLLKSAKVLMRKQCAIKL